MARRLFGRLLLLSVLLLLIVAAVAGIYVYQQVRPSPSCTNPLGGAKVLRTQLTHPVTFGGVTEYALPDPNRNPNSLAVAPDGSVWFAEQTSPVLAHFYPGNGTLVEYALPYKYSTTAPVDGVCNTVTSFWGVAFWDGKVWTGDATGNQLIGLDPTDDRVTAIHLPTASGFPYTLTPGPNDTLWFTELFTGKLGEVTQGGAVHEYSLPGGVDAEPAQIVFVNSTTGYYDDVGASESQGGGVYSFNPNDFAPVLLGGKHLTSPSSITLASGALWVALHGSSSVAAYNLTTKTWAYFPTSYVTWDGNAVTTLPYFVQADGSEVWLNEHYGNRIAMIDPANGSLSEYAESTVPNLNGSTIGNTLTFAVGGGRAWFVEWTGNIIGYVDTSYEPGFSTSILGNTTVSLPAGSSTTVNLLVKGTSSTSGGSGSNRTLMLNFADTETLTSKPSNITFTVPSDLVDVGADSQANVTVTISAASSLTPGTYTATIGVSDGLTYESSFLNIVVAVAPSASPRP
jgi:virginiamycin B lyase